MVFGSLRCRVRHLNPTIPGPGYARPRPDDSASQSTCDRRIVLDMVDVRTATVGDRRMISTTLAAAFASDPVVRWLLPRTGRDARMFHALARYLYAAPGASDIALDGGEPVGAAVWRPPGHHTPTARRLLGYAHLLRVMGPPAVRRGAVLETACAKARPPGQLWYLADLGATVPGRGIGSALLGHRLGSISGPAYLESSNVANLPLYQRFGFEVTEEFALPQGGPKLWTMLRP